MTKIEYIPTYIMVFFVYSTEPCTKVSSLNVVKNKKFIILRYEHGTRYEEKIGLNVLIFAHVIVCVDLANF